MLDRLRAVDALDDRVRLVERALDVALADAPVVVRAEVGIDRPPLVDRRPVVVERLAHVEERRPLLELDLDRLDCLARGVVVDRRHGRDRLPLVADVVLGEQRLVGRDPERLEMAVDVLRDVGVRDDREHPWECLRLRRVEARDPCMVVRRAQGLHPERPRDPDVVDVGRAPGDVRDPVVPGQPCPNRLHAGLPGISTSASSGSKLGSTSSGRTSPRRAASTALTILT